MLEITTDAHRRFLRVAQMTDRGLHELLLGARRRFGGDGLLEVGVGHLVGIELRAVAWQIEHRDVLCVFIQLACALALPASACPELAPTHRLAQGLGATDLVPRAAVEHTGAAQSRLSAIAS